MAPRLSRVPALAALCACLAAPAWAQPRCYHADADHGEMRFDGVLDGTPFTGRFGAFSVSLCLEDDDPGTARIRVTVDTGSADTGNRQGNEALRGAEFFDAARFPEATWTSRSVRPHRDGHLATGVLTVRDVSAEQPVRLSFRSGTPPRLSGEAQILRLDWEVGTGEFEDTGFLRNRVDLRFELDLEAHDGD